MFIIILRIISMNVEHAEELFVKNIYQEKNETSVVSVDETWVYLSYCNKN